jgi:hypothetical protein
MTNAEYILKHSKLPVKANCLIIDNILYERINSRKFRYFIDVDHYDYFEAPNLIFQLERIFIDSCRNAQSAQRAG